MLLLFHFTVMFNTAERESKTEYNYNNIIIIIVIVLYITASHLHHLRDLRYIQFARNLWHCGVSLSDHTVTAS